ncbi:MAG: hypothetical protein ACOYJA_10855 [Christensenellales bacterium]|jgi:hypothetical protein
MNPDLMRRALRMDILDMSPQMLGMVLAFTTSALKDEPRPRRGERALMLMDRREDIITTVYGINRPRDLDHIAAVVHAFAGGAN